MGATDHLERTFLSIYLLFPSTISALEELPPCEYMVNPLVHEVLNANLSSMYSLLPYLY